MTSPHSTPPDAAHSQDLARAIEAGDAEAANGAFDAIVVGAGAAGGLAAQLLCEAGLTVLLLDAGRRAPFFRAPFKHMLAALQEKIVDPRLGDLLPPRLVSAGRAALRFTGRWRQPVQAQCFAWERAPLAFVDDKDFPYVTAPDRPFTWIRALGIGGRMVVPGHGRQYYRLAHEDLFPSDGLSPPWPLRDGELDSWCQLVEQRLHLRGNRDGLLSPPDSEIGRETAPSPAEAAIAAAIKARWPQATPIVSRYAPPLDTVAAAAATQRLVCRTGAMAQSVIVDEQVRAKGVAWCDEHGRRQRSFAPLVFLCASTLESTRILLNSGLRCSDALGRFLMDHVMVKAEGEAGPLDDSSAASEAGRCLYLPRFDRRDGARAGRGFGVQLYRTGGGARSFFTAVAFAETTPRAENRVSLDPSKQDLWGNPTLRIDFAHSDSDLASAAEMARALRELADLAGAQIHKLDVLPAPAGLAVHECGAARMGNDPATSVLDPDNQVWAARGVYVTDGAAFPSQGSQNPTLTIMALTARACAHALQRG